ncbi:MAG: FecR domain-containing protein [Lachnospiraceae bacterium]|nr:FecR domain-containing protein [Lachnospiraceae bacterium]
MQTVEAASYAGTTIRLEKTEGTVTVKNAAGKEISLDEGGKLLNGYVVTTADKSYAWISLDDKKVLKLDAASSVELEKNKKKLTISLNAGKLFFDVKAKLTINEEMVVKSSTLVTGIRGTSGLLESDNSGEAKSSGLQVYDGTVAASALTIDPKSGKPQADAPLSVEAGNGVSVSSDSNEAPQVAEISASDIPGFAAVAIKEDPALQARIEESSNLNVQEIVDSADEKLTADEKAAEEKKESLEQAKEAEIAEDKAANESEAATEAGDKADSKDSNDSKSDSASSDNNAANESGTGYNGGGFNYYPGSNYGWNGGRGLYSWERYIDSEASLRDAVACDPYYQNTCSDYVLKNDIVITGDAVEVGRFVHIDLNGHKITLNNTSCAGITVTTQGSITIDDYSNGRGEIKAGNYFNGSLFGYGLIDVEGFFQMNGGRITAVNDVSLPVKLMGIVVRDYGSVDVYNSTVTATGYAISEETSNLNASAYEFIGDGSVVKSTSDYAVYKTSDSGLSILGTVEGAAGALYIKRGWVNVDSGAILKTDASVCKGDGKDFNGNLIKCLAVVNNANHGAELNFYGGSLVYPSTGSVYPLVEVGSQNMIYADDIGAMVYHAGSANTSNPDEFQIDNTVPYNTVPITTHVTTAGAFKLALSNSTTYKRVILDADIDIQGESVTVNKGLSVDLNGHRIDANNSDSGNIDITAGATLVLADSSRNGSGKIYANVDRSQTGYESALIEVSGHFIMLRGTINAEIGMASGNGQDCIAINNSGRVTINGGTVTAGRNSIVVRSTVSGNRTPYTISRLATVTPSP